MKYRADIDGLRAVAIVPVVLFHAGFSWFEGGFIGVDVFFVISGFLITGIIYDKSITGQFRILDFYERRARRLLPALLSVMLATTVAAHFFLLPDDYENYSKSSIWALLFASNIFFNENIDYFSQSADFMPLLHTWSLAVEEQFYLIWPTLIIFVAWAWRTGKTWAGWGTIIGLVVLSAIASEIANTFHPQSAFYLLPFRLWELGVGGLVALFAARHSEILLRLCSGLAGNVLFVIGLGLTLGSMILINKDSPFPGFAAIPVVAGTAMMLASGAGFHVWTSGILKLGIMVWIGKISYSLYLIHWPIFAFYRTYSGDVHIPYDVAVALVVLSLVLSALSYFFVESPFRKNASKPAVVAASVSGLTGLMTASYFIFAASGLPQRVKDGGLPAYAESREVMWQWDCETQTIPGLGDGYCVFGESWGSASQRFVLWGDSHAQHFAPLLERAIRDLDTSILLTKSSPPHIDHVSVKRWYRGSEQWSAMVGEQNRTLSTWLATQDHVNGIILASAWVGYPRSLYTLKPSDAGSISRGNSLTEEGLRTALSNMPDQLPVIIFGDIPRLDRNLDDCLLVPGGSILRKRKSDPSCRSIPRGVVEERQRPINNILEDVSSEFDNVTYFNMIDRMCTAEECPTFLGERLLYRDTNHIRRNLSDEEKVLLVDRLGLGQIFLQDDLAPT
ncbi:MAG: acyltransferase family protein [Pseudomonadota bacterium]